MLEEFLFYKKKLVQNQAPTVKIVSDSMEPLLKVGQKVDLVFKPIDELRQFDLIVFLENERLVCHFFWHRNSQDGCLLTRSLKKPKLSDFPVHPDFYLGFVPNINMGIVQKAKVILLNLFGGSL